MPEPELVKVCSRCGPRPISYFDSDKSKPDGLATRCKTCRRIRRENLKPPPPPDQWEESRKAALDALAAQFPTQFVKNVRSEHLKRGLKENPFREPVGWRKLA